MDSGAQVSIVPHKWYPRTTPDAGRALQAVNGTRIATYGVKHIQFRFGHNFNHTCIVADVDEPVLGFNFLMEHKLDLRWKDAHAILYHDRKPPIPLKLGPAPAPHNLGLAVVTFKQYADAIKAKEVVKAKPVPAQYQQLLDKYPGIFSARISKTPRHNVTHSIDTGDQPPCMAKPRPIMPGTHKYVQGEKTLKEMEQVGIVERIGPGEPMLWSNALHLVTKADGKVRVCGDYRPLNGKTKLDHFPIPNLRTFAAKLKGCTYFSKIDLARAYYLIPLTEESAAKTTITTPWGAFKFKRLSMGLRNAAQSFQKMMSHILAGVGNIFCYLDDILVFSNSESDHIRTVDEVLGRLHNNDLTVSLDKCEFASAELDFLGYRVNGKGIQPINKKLQAIVDFPEPTRPKELLGFLGALNYYRRCFGKVDGTSPADILQPLYRAATQKKPGVKFADTWNQEGLLSNYNLAKRMLSQACLLVHPDTSAPLALTTDASATSIGGCLEQFSNGRWEPIGFFSKHLKPNEVAWSTFKRELFALKQALRHFQTEVDGRHVTCFTDHLPILGAFQNPNALTHDSVARGHLIEVSQWTQDVRYLKGKSNFVADAMSRPSAGLLGTANTAANLTSDSPAFDLADEARLDVAATELHTVDLQALAEAQKTCPQVASHRQGRHASGLLMSDVELIPGSWVYCDTANPERPRPFVPVQMRLQIIKLFHQLNHPGNKETLRKIGHRYYWPEMRAEISNFVNQCIGCNRCKSTQTIRPPMVPRPVLQPRFQDLEVDLVGPLPPSEGHTHLLTVVDRTSRWFEALPLTKPSSDQCCDAFIRGWIRNFGIPARITSDNGNTFTSQLWADIQAKLGSIVQYTPLYSPQSLGGVERQHKDLKSGLKTALLHMGESNGEDWMQVLPWTLLARRTSYHNELRTTPAEAVLGQLPRLPGDLPIKPTVDQTIQDIVDHMKAVADRPPAQTRPPKDPVHFPDQAQEATHVYVKRPKSKTGPLTPIADGPFVIKERLGTSCLHIQTGTFQSGAPRMEVVHWRNCVPAVLPQTTTPAQRPKLGRKPRNSDP